MLGLFSVTATLIGASPFQVHHLTSSLVIVDWVLYCGFCVCPFFASILLDILCFPFLNFGMSNRKGKRIVVKSDEEIEDSYPHLFGPSDLLHSSRNVGPSYHRNTPEYPRPMAISPSLELELVGNRGGSASGSGENHGSGRIGVPEEVGDGEGSSSEPNRPPYKRNLGWRQILTLLIT